MYPIPECNPVAFPLYQKPKAKQIHTATTAIRDAEKLSNYLLI
jgi:hypothetical protein